MMDLPSRTESALTRDPEVLKVSENNFLVEGRSQEYYAVSLDDMECSCPDHQHREVVCYHMRAAALKEAKGETKDA